MRPYSITIVAAFVLAFGCRSEAQKAAYLAADVLAIAPRGTVFMDARHRVVAAGLDCDSLLLWRAEGTDTTRGMTCSRSDAMVVLLERRGRLIDVMGLVQRVGQPYQRPELAAPRL